MMSRVINAGDAITLSSGIIISNLGIADSQVATLSRPDGISDDEYNNLNNFLQDVNNKSKGTLALSNDYKLSISLHDKNDKDLNEFAKIAIMTGNGNDTMDIKLQKQALHKHGNDKYVMKITNRHNDIVAALVINVPTFNNDDRIAIIEFLATRIHDDPSLCGRGRGFASRLIFIASMFVPNCCDGDVKIVLHADIENEESMKFYTKQGLVDYDTLIDSALVKKLDEAYGYEVSTNPESVMTLLVMRDYKHDVSKLMKLDQTKHPEDYTQDEDDGKDEDYDDNNCNIRGSNVSHGTLRRSKRFCMDGDGDTCQNQKKHKHRGNHRGGEEVGKEIPPTHRVIQSTSRTSAPLAHPGNTGLDNLGNTCFMNSILQIFAHTPALADFILSGEYKKFNGNNQKIAQEFAYVITSLHRGYISYSPQDFYDKMTSEGVGNQFGGYRQSKCDYVVTCLQLNCVMCCKSKPSLYHPSLLQMMFTSSYDFSPTHYVKTLKIS